MPPLQENRLSLSKRVVKLSIPKSDENVIIAEFTGERRLAHRIPASYFKLEHQVGKELDVMKVESSLLDFAYFLQRKHKDFVANACLVDDNTEVHPLQCDPVFQGTMHVVILDALWMLKKMRVIEHNMQAGGAPLTMDTSISIQISEKTSDATKMAYVILGSDKPYIDAARMMKHDPRSIFEGQEN